MASLTEEQAKAYITKLLAAMSKAGGSDLFVSKDFPPLRLNIKLNSTRQPSAESSREEALQSAAG
jgi:twitching motility protein PilU